MKCIAFILPLVVFLSCTKQIGQPKKIDSTTSKIATNLDFCSLTDSSIINYTYTVSRLFEVNCLPCHSYPGSGGITLNRYESALAIAKGGELIQVVENMDSNNVTMPPPPQKHLDSCEIKTLTLWIKHDCPLN